METYYGEVNKLSWHAKQYDVNDDYEVSKQAARASGLASNWLTVNFEVNKRYFTSIRKAFAYSERTGYELRYVDSFLIPSKQASKQAG